MPLLIAAVMAIIVDRVRPRRGFIDVSQQSMIRLRANLSETQENLETKTASCVKLGMVLVF